MNIYVDRRVFIIDDGSTPRNGPRCWENGCRMGHGENRRLSVTESWHATCIGLGQAAGNRWPTEETLLGAFFDVTNPKKVGDDRRTSGETGNRDAEVVTSRTSASNRLHRHWPGAGFARSPAPRILASVRPGRARARSRLSVNRRRDSGRIGIASFGRLRRSRDPVRGIGRLRSVGTFLTAEGPHGLEAVGVQVGDLCVFGRAAMRPSSSVGSRKGVGR